MKDQIVIRSIIFEVAMDSAASYCRQGYTITGYSAKPKKFLFFTTDIVYTLIMEPKNRVDLKDRLQDAIIREDYELAARLRDQINGNGNKEHN